MTDTVETQPVGLPDKVEVVSVAGALRRGHPPHPPPREHQRPVRVEARPVLARRPGKRLRNGTPALQIATNYSMTRRTSPVPTVSPSATRTSRDGARGLGVDVVLHLHRFEHEHRLARLDRVALGDEHLHDGALHRRGDRAAPGRAARPPAPGRGRAEALRRAPRVPAAGASGSQSLTEKRLPSTSTGDGPLEQRLGLVGVAVGAPRARRRCRRRSAASTSSSTHLVECVAAAKSGCESSATCAGIVVLTPGDLELAERAQHAVPGGLAVGRPTPRACRSGCRSAARRCRPRA